LLPTSFFIIEKIRGNWARLIYWQSHLILGVVGMFSTTKISEVENIISFGINRKRLPSNKEKSVAPPPPPPQQQVAQPDDGRLSCGLRARRRAAG